MRYELHSNISYYLNISTSNSFYIEPGWFAFSRKVCLGLGCRLSRHCRYLEATAWTIGPGGQYVTSQGERVPQNMAIHHSQTNIKGDMSNLMKKIENFISN